MFEFGNEFIIESYKVPWLIWIQLLITVLLVLLLLVGFSLVTLDPPLNPSTATAAGGPSADGSNSSQSTDRQRIEENQKFESLGTSTSRGILRGEEIEDLSSVKDAASLLSSFGPREHPCHFIGLAKQAFLKCLGLDSSSESSSNTRHGKQD